MTNTPISLLERLRRQPSDAQWERFVRLFTPILLRWASRLGVSAADAEDLLQEVFTLLLRKLVSFDYDPQRSFRAWLWTVFHHHTIAWRKRQARSSAVGIDDLNSIVVADQITDAIENEFRKYLLDRALRLIQQDFPEQTWKLFWSVTVEGAAGVDVAKQFGVSPNAVYLARGRVLARLRSELAGLND